MEWLGIYSKLSEIAVLIGLGVCCLEVWREAHTSHHLDLLDYTPSRLAKSRDVRPQSPVLHSERYLSMVALVRLRV